MNAYRRLARPLLVALVVSGVITSACSAADWPRQQTSFHPGEVSEYQLQVLVGGVSWDEYVAAVLATMSCISDGGVAVYGPYPENGGRFLSFDYGGQKPEGESQSELKEALTAEDRVAGECANEYLSVIGPTYADANELTEAEVRERFAKERDCAEDLGFENVPNTEGEFVLFVDEHPELVPCLAD